MVTGTNPLDLALGPGSVGPGPPDTWRSADELHHGYNQHRQPALNIAWGPHPSVARSNSAPNAAGPVPASSEEWDPDRASGGSRGLPHTLHDAPHTSVAPEGQAFPAGARWEGSGRTRPGLPSSDRLVDTSALQRALQLRQGLSSPQGKAKAGWGWGTQGKVGVYTMQPAASTIVLLGGEPQQDGRYRMAGLGFGLPLTRLHARYFGGDLVLQVRHGANPP